MFKAEKAAVPIKLGDTAIDSRSKRKEGARHERIKREG
jgi:hypothetical protein